MEETLPKYLCPLVPFLCSRSTSSLSSDLPPPGSTVKMTTWAAEGWDPSNLALETDQQHKLRLLARWDLQKLAPPLLLFSSFPFPLPFSLLLQSLSVTFTSTLG